MSTCEPMFWADFQVGQAWMSSMDGVWSAPKVVKVAPLNWQQTQPSEVPPPHKNQAWEYNKRWVTQPCQKVNPIKRRFFPYFVKFMWFIPKCRCCCLFSTLLNVQRTLSTDKNNIYNLCDPFFGLIMSNHNSAFILTKKKKILAFWLQIWLNVWLLQHTGLFCSWP